METKKKVIKKDKVIYIDLLLYVINGLNEWRQYDGIKLATLGYDLYLNTIIDSESNN